MSPTGFEPVTPSLKVRCSKTSWATKTLSKWQGSNLRPDGPKPPALPNWATPRYCWGKSGIRTRGSVKISGFQDRCNKPTLPSLLIVVLQGLEPQFYGPKPHVLPLDERTIMKPICQRTFSFEVSIRFELMTPGYKAGILPTILRDQYKTKNPRFLSLGFYIPFIMLLNVFNS